MKCELQVSGMKCGSCQLLVEEAVEELQGVKSVDVSFRDSYVTVEYEPDTVSLATIKEVIEKQGFTVQA